MANSKYLEYLNAVAKPFRKLAKLEFLQPDNSVAFVLDNNANRRVVGKHDSRAFIQSGSLSVSLQNGQRRQASITLANADGAFDYAINNIWFGQRIRLQMGLLLPDGTEFYLPQGVFYIKEPKSSITPAERLIQYNLVDKWTYLDGSLMGRLPYSYTTSNADSQGYVNIFDAMSAVLRLNKYTLKGNEPAVNDLQMLDNVLPVYTNFYQTLSDITYKKANGDVVTVPWTTLPFTVTVSAGQSAADVLLELNRAIVGWIGYDQTGALRVEAAYQDIEDIQKPVMWAFTPDNSQLLGLSETLKNSEVYNDIIIVGQGIDDFPVYGRATNYDAASETNVNLIGLRTYREERSDYWNVEQCKNYAAYLAKRKTVLQKSVTIESTQMFHLQENCIVEIMRTDKDGAPIEKHLVQSFTIPIGETGTMSINATSVNDLNKFEITSSDYGTENAEN